MIDVILFALVMAIVLMILWAIEHINDQRTIHSTEQPPIDKSKASELEKLLVHMEQNGADSDEIAAIRKLIGNVR